MTTFVTLQSYLTTLARAYRALQHNCQPHELFDQSDWRFHMMHQTLSDEHSKQLETALCQKHTAVSLLMLSSENSNWATTVARWRWALRPHFVYRWNIQGFTFPLPNYSPSDNPEYLVPNTTQLKHVLQFIVNQGTPPPPQGKNFDLALDSGDKGWGALLDHVTSIYWYTNTKRSSDQQPLRCESCVQPTKWTSILQALEKGINTQPFVQQWQPLTERVIVVGDIHGGMHTLVRLLHRWAESNYLTLATGKVRDMSFVFLGDVIDRGGYSAQCILLLAFLRHLNPQHVRWIRGNHEGHPTVWTKYGLQNQLKNKNCINDRNVMTWYFNQLPVGIRLVKENRKLWLAHGGVPLHTGPLWQTFTQNKGEGSYDSIIEAAIATEIQWNDISTEQTSSSSNRDQQAHTMFQVCNKDVRRVLSELGVDWMVRGHQDNIDNFLWYEEGKPLLKTCPFSQGTPPETFSHMAHHSINASFVPTTTISTNQGYNRSLTADSYAMLSLAKVPGCVKPPAAVPFTAPATPTTGATTGATTSASPRKP